MANTLALRRRIKTAQNISKTTRAMQMIAASKLKRAQHAVVASRPYAEKLIELTTNLTLSGEKEDIHPYLGKKDITGKTLYVIIGPDKGLCGGLVTNLIREYFSLRNDTKSSFITVGKKIEGIVAGGSRLLAAFPFGTTLPSFEQILSIIAMINQQYIDGDIDTVKIISTQFVNVFSQTPKITQLLPVAFVKEEKGVQSEMLFEPTQNELLPALLKRYIETTLYQQFLESYASYNAAQMIAMQNATNNAKDIVKEFTLLYNKVRQEKITNEILDITGAAVALEEEK
ncbi:MAG: ATP synthase F1 subunit gamma [Candidatus Levyibacteriota bacterium]